MFKIHLVFLRRRWNNAFEPEPFNHIIILNISVRLFTITFGILFNIIENTRDSNDLVLFQLENTEIWPIFEGFTESKKRHISRKLCIRSFSVNTEPLGNTANFFKTP